VNFQAWLNFFGQCLLAFLLVEGVKSILFGLRTLRRSSWRVGLNLLAGALAGWFIVPGSGLFPQTHTWFVVSIIVSALVTAGLHRVVKRFRPTGIMA
jgi:uncharacterized membrane protein YedE/YeeE